MNSSVGRQLIWITEARLTQPKERILAQLRGEIPDKVPLFHIDHHILRGEKEREARNRGMGIIVYRPCHLESMRNVEIVSRTESGSLVRTYKTPLGSLSEVLAVGVGYGCGGPDFRDWKGVQPRRKELLVKKPEDYEILKFIVENIHYEPYYLAIEDQIRNLGSDGIVVTVLPYEPMQRLIIEWVEWKRFYIDLRKRTKVIEEIVEILEEKYVRELFPLAADSPSEVIRYGGNIDTGLINPPMFQRYYLPTYAKCAGILHPKGKVLSVHMDGRLKALEEQIARSKVDIVEAFTPPPMGDLSVDDAVNAWKDKILWINFPSAISTQPAHPSREVKKYLIGQLRQLIPDGKAALIVSTENRIPQESLIAIVDVMEKTTLPLSENLIHDLLTSLKL